MASGSQPILRIRGEMERVKYKSFESEELKKLLYDYYFKHATDNLSFEKTDI